MFAFVMLIIGFIFLVGGADHFVVGASSLAKKMGIPPLIVGLTVIAMGTSAPELTVSVTAGMKGANALAISNVIGSNLFNLMVVLGTCSVITKQRSDPSLLKRDWPFFLAGSFALALMVIFDHTLSRMDGLLLLFAFVLVITTQIRAGLRERHNLATEDNDDVPTITSPLGILGRIVVGCLGIVIGGDFCVEYATEIAYMFGLSETIVGLTVVSVGTSLPELVTSVIATKKGESDMAVGNVVGSNLFNILLILGTSSVLSPIPMGQNAVIDLCFMLLISLLVFWTTKQDDLGRVFGCTLLFCYVIYMIYVVYRDLQVETVTAIM